uniref:Uncharacterized protein MANES_04G119100 n=1 Tax=Rhizophora mucronata TaxID=61149 RepID=A0A2P2P7F5_RHIMU
MEAMLQTREPLSLPPNPKSNPSNGLKRGLFVVKPKTPRGFSLSSNGLNKFPSFVSKPNGVLPKERNLHVCRAEAVAAAAADGQPYLVKKLIHQSFWELRFQLL